MSDGSFVDWAVASRAKPGEVRCGDLATVHVDEERCVMAVMDGLGHGPHAAVAAERMAAVVREHRTEPPDRLLMLAHKGLVDTRGVTATIAAIDATLHRMTWLGVGNVSGALVRADPDTRPRTHGVFLGRGVLGHQMPPLHRPEPLRLAKGDCIVFNTDGVHADVTAATHTHLSVERIAQTILDNGALPNDDALVLVARYYPTDEGALPR